MRRVSIILPIACAGLLAARVSPAAQADQPLAIPDYHEVALGPVINGEASTGMVGDGYMGGIGVASFGLRSQQRRWLLQWDASLGARVGDLFNQYAHTLFVGGAAHFIGEIDRRFGPMLPWRPYLGVRLAVDRQVMSRPGMKISALKTINNSDGFGGVSAEALLRVVAGLSFLDSARSFLLFALVQERLRSPGVVVRGAAFTEVGLGIRLDLRNRIALWVEGTVGTTRAVPNRALQFTDQTTHVACDTWLRRSFAKGFWLALSVKYGRDSDTIVYQQGQSIFATVDPAHLSASLLLGWNLWRSP